MSSVGRLGNEAIIIVCIIIVHSLWLTAHGMCTDSTGPVSSSTVTEQTADMELNVTSVSEKLVGCVAAIMLEVMVSLSAPSQLVCSSTFTCILTLSDVEEGVW